MAVLYVFVAHGDVLLSEAGNPNHIGTHRQLLLSALTRFYDMAKNSIENVKLSHSMDGFTYNFRLRGRIAFTCVSEDAFGKAMGFVFLRDVLNTFHQTFPTLLSEHSTLDPRSFVDFAPTLRIKLQKFSGEDQALDKAVQAKEQLEEVKLVMIDNINKAAERGAHLRELADRSEELTLTSDRFRRKSKALERSVWWSDIKCKVFMGLGFVVATASIVFWVCDTCWPL